MKTYIIEYTISGKLKKMRVKNCYTELHAKMKFSDYMERSNPDVGFYVQRCYEEIFGDVFGETFADIFR